LCTERGDTGRCVRSIAAPVAGPRSAALAARPRLAIDINAHRIGITLNPL
jgi:hypothetical protein